MEGGGGEGGGGTSMMVETQEACLNVRSRASELKIENKRANKSESMYG